MALAMAWPWTGPYNRVRRIQIESALQQFDAFALFFSRHVR